MSVINRVLKDLDRKGGAATVPAGVQAVRADLAPRRRYWPWGVLLVATLAAAWDYWSGTTPPAALPEQREVAPRLRLSETLDSSGPPSRTGFGAGGEGATVDLPTHSKSIPVEPTKPEPPRALQRSALSPAPPPEGGRKEAAAISDIPPSIKLDTHLPEARPPRVVKENRVPTPREQVEADLRQATRLIEQGRGRDAAELLEAALRLDPGHGPARQTLVALSLESGDTARGEALLREGLRLHTGDPWYHRALSQLFLRRGDTAQALATLKAGLGKGADAAYWGLYAALLGKAARPAEAVPAYREATRLDPDHGPWWIGLAVSLEQSGARSDAAAAYQRALQAKLSPEVRDYAAKKAAELAP
jgi:MSHA biogenesis protein MshN